MRAYHCLSLAGVDTSAFNRYRGILLLLVSAAYALAAWRFPYLHRYRETLLRLVSAACALAASGSLSLPHPPTQIFVRQGLMAAHALVGGFLQRSLSIAIVRHEWPQVRTITRLLPSGGGVVGLRWSTREGWCWRAAHVQRTPSQRCAACATHSSLTNVLTS